eukprot:maker-scaffold_77-snap-gene-0.1-mRNA-1 protein AED:0.02 eAED:0.02 QI:8/1/1/1/1/1/2/568/462
MKEEKKKAHWKDPNIVLESDGKWYQVPENYFGNPPPILTDSWKLDSSSIVILIAALRESRLKDTIVSAVDNAINKERIFFVVVQQNDGSNEDVIQEVCNMRKKPVKYRDPKANSYSDILHMSNEHAFINENNCFEFDHVRVLRLHSSEAKGPVYARGRQTELVKQDDEFCMQIDAHTIFKKNWDELMLNQWGATENEYAVLSTYPTNYKHLEKNSNNHWEMPHLCSAAVLGDGLVRNGQAKAAANLERPILAPLWAAGLSFSKCHAERNIPNDVNLEHIFTGEEFARGARLWTHGYDFYTISRPVIGVYYGKEKGGKGSWHRDQKALERSQRRLATLLRAPNSDQSVSAYENLKPFTLGNKRSLDQYFKFSGVNTTARTSNEKCIVQYVPWDYTGYQKELARVDAGSFLRKTDVIPFEVDEPEVSGASIFSFLFLLGVLLFLYTRSAPFQLPWIRKSLKATV